MEDSARDEGAARDTTPDDLARHLHEALSPPSRSRPASRSNSSRSSRSNSNSSHGTSTRSAHLSVSNSASRSSSSSSSSRRRKQARDQPPPPSRHVDSEDRSDDSSNLTSEDVGSDKTRWPRGVPLPTKFASTSSTSSSSAGQKHNFKRNEGSSSGSSSLSSSSYPLPIEDMPEDNSMSFSSTSSFSLDVNTPRTLSPPASAAQFGAGSLHFGPPANIPSTELLARAARLAAADRQNLWAAVSIMRPTMLDGDSIAAWRGREGVRAAVAHFARRGKRAHVITSSRVVACFGRRVNCNDSGSSTSGGGSVDKDDDWSERSSKTKKSGGSHRSTRSSKSNRSNKSSKDNKSSSGSASAAATSDKSDKKKSNSERSSVSEAEQVGNTGHDQPSDVQRVDRNATAVADAANASSRKRGSSRKLEGEGVSLFPSRALALRALSRAARNGADVVSNEWRDRAARRLLHATGGLSDDDSLVNADADVRTDDMELHDGGGRPGRVVPFLFVGDRFVPQRSSSWSASPSVSVSGVGGVAGSVSSSGASSSVRAIPMSQQW